MEWLDRYRACLAASLPGGGNSYAEVSQSSPSYYVHDISVGGDTALICSYGPDGESYFMASVDRSDPETPRLEPQSMWTEVERTFVAKTFTIRPDADGYLLADDTFVRPLDLARVMRERDHRDLTKFRPNPEETDTSNQPAAETASRDIEEPASYAVTKAVEEKRFTYGPLYAPDRIDAHGEYVESDVLQQAVWDYVRQSAGEGRRLKLQHGMHGGPEDFTIGEWVEITAWPYETEVAITTADGVTKNVTLPADTIYMGVIWDEEAWPLVKTGKIGGLSMGGKAVRVQEPNAPDLQRMGGSS